MHELSVCRQIMQTVGQFVDDVRQIDRINIAVGELAAIDTASLAFWFPVVAGENEAKDAKLVIEHVAALADCQHCHHRFPLKKRLSACPNCQQYGYQLLSGEELSIKTIEVK